MIRAALRYVCLALCLVLAGGVDCLHAELEPKLAKKLIKLEKQLAKQQLKLQTALDTLADYTAQVALAELNLAAAEALPEDTPEALKAKTKAVKLAAKQLLKLTKKVGKWQGKSDKADVKLQDVMAEIVVLVPDYFEQTTSGEDDGDGDSGDGEGEGEGEGEDAGGGEGEGDPGEDDPPAPDLDPALALPLLSIDCGDLNGFPAPEPGWTLLTETSSPAGVSVSPAPLDTVHVATYYPLAGAVVFPSSVTALDPDQVGERRKLTALKLADPTTLTLSGLPPSTRLRVLLELGATAPWVELVGAQWTALDSSTRGLRVEVDGPAAGTQYVTVAQDLRCGTSINSSSFQTDTGSILPLWIFGTTDSAGVLRLRLSSDSEAPVLLAAFSVYRHESLPIVYRRTGAGPLQSSAPAAAAFVAAFNAGDLDAAQSLAQGLADPLLRGVALAHVAGWLDGGREDRTALLPELQSALQLAQAQGHAAASVLLEQLAHLQRALAHFEARGYSAGKDCPSEGGPGFLNPACAGQLYAKLGQSDSNVNFQIGVRELRGLTSGGLGPNALWDLAAWNAGVLTESTWEPSPLTFLALKQAGVALVALNPLFGVNTGNPESVAFQQAARDIFDGFRDLSFASLDFPHDHELTLLAAAVDAGQHPKSWDAAALQLFSTAELQDSWWGPGLLEPADVPSAPDWANAQRRLQRALSSFVAEWHERRLRGDEFGGGWGDDIELLLQHFWLLGARRNGSERLLASRFDDLVHYGLEESGSVVDGYWAGAITDVEHTSEYTADPFLTSRAVFGDTARTALMAGRNARHVLQPEQAGQAFAAVSNTGRTHFRSYWFTTLGPGGTSAEALDVFLNGRAVAPAFMLGQRGSLGSNHPVVTDLRAWAAGWRDDALLAGAGASGKPVGFPAAAQWPGNALGVNGVWYSQLGVAGDTSQWTTGEVSYVLGLMHGAYRQSQAGDRWQFLLPAVRMFRAVKNWEDAGSPAGAVGSTHWAAAQFKGGMRFGHLVLLHLPELAADTTLNTQVDPLGSGGATYVDAALLARLRNWLLSETGNQGPVLRYALRELGDCDPHEVKNPGAVTQVFEGALAYLRTAWPLLVRHVLHTDRVFANPASVQAELLTAWCGAPVVEGLPWLPLVRWGGESLDLAVLMNQRDEAGTKWSAFVHNFAAAPTSVTLTLEQGLQPGTYLLELGPAVTTCDIFPAGVTASVVVTKRGLTAAAGLTLAPGLSLVRLTRTGSAAAAEAWDLVLDPPRLTGSVAGGATVKVRVANAGSVAAPASSLDLHVAAVDGSGALVSVPALPSEQLLASTSVSLGGATGFVLPEHTASFALPPGSPLLALLDAGYGLQFRAQVAAGAAEWDPYNNAQSRCWFIGEFDLTE